MKTIINDSLDPRYNLALEEYVLKHLDTKEDFVLLWQNANSVIIGRNQNTIEEVNAAYVESHRVNVVRRITGGGAVYHDMGNLNFSFITASARDNVNNYRKFIDPVVAALRSFGVPAEFSGRNDIVVDGMKISGNAQAYHKHRMLHHGTILLNADLTMIFNVLDVKPDKIASKGIKSNRARVTNIMPYLKEPVSMAEFKERLLKYLLGSEDISRHVYMLTRHDQEKIQALIDEKYATWAWNYGQSPAFSLECKGRYEGGGISIRLNIEEGLIKSCRIYGDFLGVEDIAGLEEKLVGIRYDKATLETALARIDLDRYLLKISRDDILDCLFK
ncbi:MAG: lipoate--protein ligase [Bacilli bacterium]|jgi:lipoate-protein ligase A